MGKYLDRPSLSTFTPTAVCSRPHAGVRGKIGRKAARADAASNRLLPCVREVAAAGSAADLATGPDKLQVQLEAVRINRWRSSAVALPEPDIPKHLVSRKQNSAALHWLTQLCHLATSPDGCKDIWEL